MSSRVVFAGHVFDILDNVYEPAEDSFLFAENLSVRRGCKVVDVGTGCGILAVIAAKKAGKVVAIDVNPYAVKCAKNNTEINDVGNRVSFIRGDLFAPLRTRKEFDLILFNAPYLPSEENEKDSWTGWAWAGGVSGRNVIDRFLCEAPKHLRPRGEIMLMQSTLSNVEQTLRILKESGLEANVIAKQNLPFFESIVLIRGVNRS
ncbi:MAG TPA: HemK2/MTQ2 family protein methyltransferase [candidate division Zixibacteria bacterium]|nr:HemK2/MTQ2 family protein methyltransferase [candidate division Zixibacteria bacterium]